MNSQTTVIIKEASAPGSRRPTHLTCRLVWLAALFAGELLAISLWLDTAALQGRGGFIGAMGSVGARVLQSLVAFSTVFVACGYVKARDPLLESGEPISEIPLQWRFLTAHVAAMGAFALLSRVLFGPSRGLLDNFVACAWLLTGILGIATAVFFLIPLPSLARVLRRTGPAWLYALVAACVTPAFVEVSRLLWRPATALTFQLVSLLLRPFVVTTGDLAAASLGTKKFTVEIAPGCSGLEGMGLMLIFGALWLGFFHRDYRFPRALLLIPVGMGLMFLLNSVRIAALILIGNAGAERIALGGFHSQAGWIAFNGLAFGLVSVAQRVPWMSSHPTGATADRRPVRNPTAVYLMPFLAILGAAMVASALAAGFEWLYPLRLAAAALAFFLFRKEFAKIDWRFGWAGPLIGLGAFVLWIAMDRIAGISSQGSMPAELAAAPSPLRLAWLVCRTLAAVVTVPVAEELAFRGFLLRRLISADFESVNPRHWTFLAVAGSSIAFGGLHGDRWIAGIFAGVLYAAAQKWRGRLGDAVIAHATTNALISVSVLSAGQWALW